MRKSCARDSNNSCSSGSNNNSNSGSSSNSSPPPSRRGLMGGAAVASPEPVRRQVVEDMRKQHLEGANPDAQQVRGFPCST